MRTTSLLGAVLLLAGLLTPDSAMALTMLTVGYNCDVSRLEIDEKAGTTTTTELTGYSTPGCNAMASNRTGDVFVTGSSPSGGFTNRLYSVDALTGAFSTAMILPTDLVALRHIRGIAADDKGTVYALGVIDPNSQTGAITEVFALDLNNRTASLISSRRGAGFSSFERTTDGTLYGWNIRLGLLILQPESGAWLDVDPSDNAPGNNAQDAVLMQAIAQSPDGRLFGALDGSLYLIDRNSGGRSLFLSGISQDIRGMAFLIPEPTTMALTALVGVLLAGCQRKTAGEA